MTNLSYYHGEARLPVEPKSPKGLVIHVALYNNRERSHAHVAARIFAWLQNVIGFKRLKRNRGMREGRWRKESGVAVTYGMSSRIMSARTSPNHRRVSSIHHCNEDLHHAGERKHRERCFSTRGPITSVPLSPISINFAVFFHSIRSMYCDIREVSVKSDFFCDNRILIKFSYIFLHGWAFPLSKILHLKFTRTRICPNANPGSRNSGFNDNVRATVCVVYFPIKVF